MKRVLSFDFGASSGRAIMFSYDGKIICAKELHRFDNVPYRQDGTLYWDFPALMNELFIGMEKAVADGGFESIGIDTWGVDFGLLDKNGVLIENPVHYRDSRTDTMPDEVFSILPKNRLYGKTGIQIMPFNTIFQLYYVKKYKPELYDRADKLLLIPDLMAYFLTGKMHAERTIASTTQLTDAATKDWSEVIIDALGFKRSLFPDIIDSGSEYGMLKDDICKKLGINSVPVIAVCCHDTASAIFSVPANGHPLYLSCGTWSLLGTLSDNPILSEESMAANFTNETGYGGVTRYLKNIMGLWIINECRREWKKSRDVSFSQIVDEAKKISRNEFIIDVDDDAFLKPDNMPERIKDYCVKKYGDAPRTMGEIARCVYESLCVRYREVISALSSVTDKKYDTLYVVGGGCKAEYLCEMISSVCKIKVSAGPVEATAIGNALVQFIALKVFDNGEHLKNLIKKSFDIKEYGT